MTDATTPHFELTLKGAWTTAEASERLEFLRSEVRRREDARQPATIDFSEITDLDACGCQLLAVFLENLRRRGVATETRRITPQIRERIDLLGFAGLITLPAAYGQETT